MFAWISSVDVFTLFVTGGIIQYTKWLNDITKNDQPLVGDKAAHLGELNRHDLPVPDYFVLTVDAVTWITDKANLASLFTKRHKTSRKPHQELVTIAKAVSQAVQKIVFPKPIERALHEAYLAFERNYPKESLAIRTSTIAEYHDGRVWDNHQKPFLNIRSFDDVKHAILASIAGTWNPENLYHYELHGIVLDKVKFAVMVQRMVAADVSGGLMSVSPVERETGTMIIEAGFGLGLATSAGEITPDRYVVDKASLAIVSRQTEKQTWKIVALSDRLKHVAIPAEQQNQPKISDETIGTLARYGRQAEELFGYPQDMEWALMSEKIWFLHARPVMMTNIGRSFTHVAGEVIARGIPAAIGLAHGPVKIVHQPISVEEFPEQTILVTELTTPSFAPLIQKAVAVITNTGGMTTHAALIAREFGVPCVVGVAEATQLLQDGQVVTVDGAHGVIYKGAIPIPAITEVHKLAPSFSAYHCRDWITGTKIYINLAEPDQAKQAAHLPVDGVGLIRAEFLISQLGEHPKSIIGRGQQADYVNHIARGLETIARAFHPRPVVYRTSDFKTNEYRGLKGGEQFEPAEQNPALGWRGAVRYLDEPELYKLELEAIKKIRDEQGLTNLWLMIPFVRTPEELQAVLTLTAESGLQPTRDFKIWLMVETPGNVFSIENYCQLNIQGVSIGSNDLTQLVLGIDRDHSQLSKYFDERDPAVLTAMKQVVRVTQSHQITSSICGNGASIHPELIAELVESGITSVSVVPDVAEQTRRLVASVEKRILLERALHH